MKYISIILCTIFIITLTACGKGITLQPGKNDPDASHVSININRSKNQTKQQTSIDDVLDTIYENIIIDGVQKAKDEDMEDIFGFDMSIIDEYYVRYSSKNYGLADVYVIKTDEKYQQDIFEKLTEIKEDKTEQFENYIIYDSLDIAKKAEIYTKGDYVIMIMVKDQEQAKMLLDNLLSEKE